MTTGAFAYNAEEDTKGGRRTRVNHYRVLNRTQALMALAALFVAASAATLLLTGVPGAFAAATAAGRRRQPIRCTDRADRVISLTVDVSDLSQEGAAVRELAGAFAEQRVCATFFITGAWAQRYPETIAALQTLGQEVQSAGDDVAPWEGLSQAEASERLRRGMDGLKAAAGSDPTLFRPADGGDAPEMLDAASALGLKTVLYDVDSFDAAGLPADGIVKRVTGQAASGSIVRFSAGGSKTADALPALIQELRGRDYRFLSLSDMLYAADYTVNREGRQITKQQ